MTVAGESFEVMTTRVLGEVKSSVVKVEIETKHIEEELDTHIGQHRRREQYLWGAMLVALSTIFALVAAILKFTFGLPT